MTTLIEQILTEQIASLQATAGNCIRQRADALAAAEAASVQLAGANARAEQLHAALDEYRASLPPIEPPATELPESELPA